MKKLILVLTMLAAVSVAQAGYTIDFIGSQYTYTGVDYSTLDSISGAFTGLLEFTDATVSLGLGSPSDNLVGSIVAIDDLEVSNVSGNTADVLAVAASDNVVITHTSGIVLKGALNTGTLERINATTGIFSSTITDLVITNVDNSVVDSAALEAIENWLADGNDTADFIITLQMQSGFVMDADSVYTSSYSGSIAIPVPGAFLLGGIGVACVGWIKRRRSL